MKRFLGVALLLGGLGAAMLLAAPFFLSPRPSARTAMPLATLAPSRVVAPDAHEPAETDTIPVTVKGVTLEPGSQTPVVILIDDASKKVIPIYIGTSEAMAISMHLNRIPPPRPMTHDLIRNILERTHVTVHKIIIHDVQGTTVLARLYLDQAGTRLVLDSRPSDALAIALRMSAPIFTTRKVRDMMGVDMPAPEKKETF